MADQDQGLINVARMNAQSNPTPQNVAVQQATSDRLSAPNHRLPVMKAHPASVGVTKVPALVDGS